MVTYTYHELSSWHRIHDPEGIYRVNIPAREVYSIYSHVVSTVGHNNIRILYLP